MEESGSINDNESDTNEQIPSSLKRQLSTDSNCSNDNKNKSKRFVWPDALHRDFVAAVFDIGLKYATSTQLLELLPQSNKVNSNTVKSQLLKFRIHRDRNHNEQLSHYQSSIILENQQDENDDTIQVSSKPAKLSKTHKKQMAVLDAEIVRQRELDAKYKAEQIEKLESRINSVATVIKDQRTFLQILDHSLMRQSYIYDMMVNKLKELDPNAVNASHLNNIESSKFLVQNNSVDNNIRVMSDVYPLASNMSVADLGGDTLGALSSVPIFHTGQLSHLTMPPLTSKGGNKGVNSKGKSPRVKSSTASSSSSSSSFQRKVLLCKQKKSISLLLTVHNMCSLVLLLISSLPHIIIKHFY